MVKRRCHPHRRYLRRKRKSIFRSRWFWDFVLILIFAGSLSWLLFKTPYFEIRDVKILGQSKEVKEKVKKIIDQENENFFLLNSIELSKNIEEIFPQIKKLVVERKFPDSLLVNIEERKEVGIFCLRNKNLSCFSISDDGVIFKETKKRDGMLLIFLAEEKELKLGEEAVENNLIKDIIFLREELEKTQIFLEEVEVFPFKIKVKAKQGFLIYFSREFDFETQMKILLEVFQEIISKEERDKLEYIDLRGVEEGKRGEIYWK